VALVTAAELSNMNIGSTVAALVLLVVVLLLVLSASSLALLLLVGSVSLAVNTRDTSETAQAACDLLCKITLYTVRL
jgi:CHASE3 domain sensor protein